MIVVSGGVGFAQAGGILSALVIRRFNRLVGGGQVGDGSRVQDSPKGLSKGWLHPTPPTSGFSTSKARLRRTSRSVLLIASLTFASRFLFSFYIIIYYNIYI